MEVVYSSRIIFLPFHVYIYLLLLFSIFELLSGMLIAI